MQKTLVAAAVAAVLGIGGTASAADMYGGGARGGPGYGPVGGWSGFYLGGQVGGAWGDFNTTDVNAYWAEVTGAAPLQTKQTTSGIFGGGQIGYNLQFGSMVYGLEVDLGYMGLAGNAIINSANVSETAEARLGGGIYGDATGRLGFTMGPALFYSKGGFAYYNGEARAYDPVYATPRGTSSAFTGWTVGGGLEYLVGPGWSVKAEYQYFSFGTEHSILQDNTTSVSYTFDHDITAQTIKAGINFHMYDSYQPLK